MEGTTGGINLSLSVENKKGRPKAAQFLLQGD